MIIAYRDLDGDPHGINAWPATGNAHESMRKELVIAKKIDQTLAVKLRQESEETKDDAYPESARGTPPNRTKVYSVRLSDQEEDQI